MESMEPVDFYGSPGLSLSAASRLSSNDFHTRSTTTTTQSERRSCLTCV